jgi:HTH-type transcriptional regulator / antitoxin HipB
MNAMQLGAAVREARQTHNLTHKTLANAAQVSVQFLVDLEQGKPTIQLDKALATAAFCGIGLTANIDTTARAKFARFAAVSNKNVADEKLNRFHRNIVTTLQQNPANRADILAQAQARVDLWERDSLCAPEYIARWRAALNGGPSAIQTEILDDPTWAKALVQNSPFGFLKRTKVRANA